MRIKQLMIGFIAVLTAGLSFDVAAVHAEEEHSINQKQIGVSGKVIPPDGHTMTYDPNPLVYEWVENEGWSRIWFEGSGDSESGDYFVAVDPGTYRICVSTEMTVTTDEWEYWNSVIGCHGGDSSDPADGTDVTVVEGIDTVGIDIYLPKIQVFTATGTIAGSVTDADGNPLEGIEVVSFFYDYFAIFPTATSLYEVLMSPITSDILMESTTTLADGTFELTVKAGRQTILFSDPSENYVDEGYDDLPYSLGSWENTIIDVVANQTMTIMTAALDKAPPANSMLQGTISVEGGESIAWGDFSLAKLDESTGQYSIVVSGELAADGVYSATRLTAGTYHLCYIVNTISNNNSGCYEQKSSRAEATEIMIGEDETVTLDFTIVGHSLPTLTPTSTLFFTPEPTPEPSETPTPIPTPEIIIPENSGQSSSGEPIPLGVTLNQVDGTAVATITILIIVTSALLISGTTFVFQQGRKKDEN